MCPGQRDPDPGGGIPAELQNSQIQAGAAQGQRRDGALAAQGGFSQRDIIARMTESPLQQRTPPDLL